MRVVFAGTPAFAVPSLRGLAAEGHEVVLVLSQPDRPKGRGRRVEPTPVGAAAAALGLAVLQPERIRDAADAIREARADVIVTAAYGQKVPDSILGLARHGGLNVHASLLPRHRGAAPIAHAILAGDGESGITVFRMVREMDAGPVLTQRAVPIPPEATAGELEGLLSVRAPEVLLEALGRLESGTARFADQDNALATLAPKLSREDGALDWNRPAAELARRVRAMSPWPVASAILVRPEGTRLRLGIHAARAVPGALPGSAGDILGILRGAVRVRTGVGGLDLLRVQPESRRQMSADEFSSGFRLRNGAWRLETPR